MDTNIHIFTSRSASFLWHYSNSFVWVGSSTVDKKVIFIGSNPGWQFCILCCQHFKQTLTNMDIDFCYPTVLILGRLNLQQLEVGLRFPGQRLRPGWDSESPKSWPPDWGSVSRPWLFGSAQKNSHIDRK